MKNEIVLILGSFNPPTNAHVKISEALHNILPEAEICYVIANENYIRSWKGQEKILPMNKRGELLINSIDGEYASISLIEGSSSVDGKAYNTVNHFKEKYSQVYVCIGEDNLIDLDKWYNSKKLIQENKFFVMCRGDVSISELYEKNPNFRFIDFNYSGISATKVREAYRNNNLDLVRDDIPKNVYEFLKSNKEVF